MRSQGGDRLKVKALRDDRTIRVVCISDTHGLHREIQIPGGDILIHAGDFTFFGKTPGQFADFDDWLGGLPHPTKIVIPGNHEFLIESGDQGWQQLNNATLLINRGVEASGLKIWGSPLTNLWSGAFCLTNAEDRRKIYDSLPADTDILVTHGPPYGILDRERAIHLHSGCSVLREIVTEINPRLHVFGHIHGGHGSIAIGPTTFANVAMLAKSCHLDHAPFVIDLETKSMQVRATLGRLIVKPAL